MRSFPKTLATLVAGATLAAGIVALASPASATPEDGEGCAGFPAIPASYICVISVTPQNAVPTTTTTAVPVSVPRFCYVAGCVGPTTVNVPVPGVQPGSGLVAVVWYQGTYIPVAVGTVPPLPGGGVPDPNDILWIPFEVAFGSREAWSEFRDNLYGEVCYLTNAQVCLF